MFRPFPLKVHCLRLSYSSLRNLRRIAGFFRFGPTRTKPHERARSCWIICHSHLPIQTAVLDRFDCAQTKLRRHTRNPIEEIIWKTPETKGSSMSIQWYQLSSAEGREWLRGSLPLTIGLSIFPPNSIEPVIFYDIKKGIGLYRIRSLNLFRLKLLISILLLPSMTCSASASPIAAECLNPWPEHGDAMMMRSLSG